MRPLNRPPLRLIGALGLIFVLGCACGELGKGFNTGMNQAMVENFDKLQAKVLALPPAPPRRMLLAKIAEGKQAATAGQLELVDSSVWLGECEGAISDGQLTPEEARDLADKYDAMAAGK